VPVSVTLYLADAASWALRAHAERVALVAVAGCCRRPIECPMDGAMYQGMNNDEGANERTSDCINQWMIPMTWRGAVGCARSHRSVLVLCHLRFVSEQRI